MKLSLLLLLAAGLPSLVAAAFLDGAPKNPPELGAVTWGRDLAAAQRQSRESGRPIAVLFQEVPGCSTCVGFGKEALSDPLLVEALEDEFVPLLVFNNKGGDDEKVRLRFGEPAFNNPVVRFLDADAADVIPRADSIWSQHGLAERMIAALAAAKRDVPRYLASARDEAAPGERGALIFAMACFWEGEGKLGGIDGVLRTRAGFVDGKEVVQVIFDPKVASIDALVKAALSLDCASRIYAGDDATLDRLEKIAPDRATRLSGEFTEAPASDQKHALAHSDYKALLDRLTPMQAARVNAAIASGASDDAIRAWLSPRQRKAVAR